MTLEYLNINICLTVAFATLSGAFATNTLKNNIANTVQANLDKVTSDCSNFNEIKKNIKKDITFTARAQMFVFILLLTSFIQLLITIISWIFSETSTNIFFDCFENVLLTIFCIGIINALVAIIFVFTSPCQNLFSANWKIPEQ